MHAIFQDRSCMRGTLPELGLKEVFLKNENLGNEEMHVFICNLLSFLLTPLDRVAGENWMRTKRNSVVSTKTSLAFFLPM